MGFLKDYRKWKKQKEQDEILEKFLKPVNELEQSLLSKIAELEDRINRLEKKQADNASALLKDMSPSDIRKLKAMNDGKTTPEEFVKMFADEREEFYPNGRENSSRTN